MVIKMSKELLIRIPEKLYLRVKEVSGQEEKSMSAFIRETLKDRLDDMVSQEDWDDVYVARKEFRKGKTVSWRSVKRG